jgi:hypothetical protein
MVHGNGEWLQIGDSPQRFRLTNRPEAEQKKPLTKIRRYERAERLGERVCEPGGGDGGGA